MLTTEFLWRFLSSTDGELSERSGPSQSFGMFTQTQGVILQLTINRAYMFDGLYQSIMLFFSCYLLFAPANFNTASGHSIDDNTRMGVYVAATAVFVANTYILFNTYRWDYITLIVVAVSILLIYFWTGVWTTNSTNATSFYRAAPQVFGNLSYWAYTLCISIICLLPRFTIKSAQKMFFPGDVDIIRENVKQGYFDYLNPKSSALIPANGAEKPAMADSASDSSAAKRRRAESHATDTRPIYPPSTTTHATHARPNGSNGTQYTDHTLSPVGTRQSQDLPRHSGSGRPSLEMAQIARERSRPSFDRSRQSMDRVRASFEQSDHFTSAAMLQRLESSGSGFKFSRERKSTIGEEGGT